MRFTAIDIELANHRLSSICQIGIAVFEDGALVETWESYINPVEDFSPYTTRIHGIGMSTVWQAPKKHEVAEELAYYLDGQHVVSYGTLDQNAIIHNYPKQFQMHWYDVTHIVRHSWPQFKDGGFALKKMADFLKLDPFQHHNALDDAIVCGEVLCHALTVSKKPLQRWPSKKITKAI